MAYHIPRIVLAGTNSGCGKTSVSCAVLQALINRGLRVGAAKCGPDYIDPMFHSRIIGAKSSNLDAFFFGDDMLRQLLHENATDCDVTIIEGVMGYYDGIGPTSTRASTYEIARRTKSPVILIVRARGAALSVLATIQGFLRFMPDSGICGVILNGCTAMSYPPLADAIEERFGIRALGFLPQLKECALESRHLGLVTAAEVANLKEKMQHLASAAEQSIDLDGILSLARNAETLSYQRYEVSKFDESVRIGVARDKAFCFYYEDSLTLLRKMGAELVPFSPVEDAHLPKEIHGMYLGGGYPELYAQTLSENISMREDIGFALSKGLPCIAECGGFMYLTEKIAAWPMVGFLRGNCRDMGKLMRFGYVTLTAQRDNLLCRKGEAIRAHEFHHWDADDTGDGFTAEKPSGRSWNCVHVSDTLYAGFPHFHFCANPRFALNFYEACRKEKHHAGMD